MSLISEALKKAQRMRSDPMAAASGSDDGGREVVRRGRPPRPAKTLALVAAGVAALMIGAVLVTILVVRRNPPPPPPVVANSGITLPKVTSTPAAPAPSSAAILVSVAPTPSPVTPESRPEPVPSRHLPADERPSPTRAIRAPTAEPRGEHPATLPRSSPPAPIPPPAPAGPAKADPRVQAFVDAVHVTGIRSSGAESKVLMNDRVFRINDIVDRSLNVRLTEVRTDSLVFVDENGFAYVKIF